MPADSFHRHRGSRKGCMQESFSRPKCICTPISNQCNLHLHHPPQCLVYPSLDHWISGRASWRPTISRLYIYIIPQQPGSLVPTYFINEISHINDGNDGNTAGLVTQSRHLWSSSPTRLSTSSFTMRCITSAASALEGGCILMSASKPLPKRCLRCCVDPRHRRRPFTCFQIQRSNHPTSQQSRPSAREKSVCAKTTLEMQLQLTDVHGLEDHYLMPSPAVATNHINSVLL